MLTQLSQRGYHTIAINRDCCDLAQSDSQVQIWDLIDRHRPDVIINCAGIYDPTLLQDQDPIMRVNFGSNWSIVNRVAKDPWPVRIVMIGSSAYSHGRPQHLLYAASKAALHNLWSGAKEMFGSGPVKIDVVHPVRVRTSMTAHMHNQDVDFLEPEHVAEVIVGLIESDLGSQCVEINFGGNK